MAEENKPEKNVTEKNVTEKNVTEKNESEKNDNIKEYKVKKYENGSFTKDVNFQSFKHQHFIDSSAISVVISKCNFSYSVFTRVYFRKVKFVNCDFTGAKFFDSNLRDATFENCNFTYSLFKFTIVDKQQIFNNLPEWPNAKMYLMQNLKANSNSLGDVGASKMYLLEEIEANKEHWRRAIKKNESYYTTKYKGFFPTLDAYCKYFVIRVDDIIWGHGESPFKIVKNLFIVLIITSFLITLSDGCNTSVSYFNQFWGNLKAEFKIFLGISQEVILSDALVSFIVLMRYLTLGLYIRVLFNRYSWR